MASLGSPASNAPAHEQDETQTSRSHGIPEQVISNKRDFGNAFHNRPYMFIKYPTKTTLNSSDKDDPDLLIGKGEVDVEGFRFTNKPLDIAGEVVDLPPNQNVEGQDAQRQSKIYHSTELTKSTEAYNLTTRRTDFKFRKDALVEDYLPSYSNGSLGQECVVDESDREEIPTVSLFERSSLAGEIQEYVNEADMRAPIMASEERVVHHTSEVPQSVSAGGKQSEDAENRNDDDDDSDAADSTVLPVEEPHYQIELNCSADFRINALDSNHQKWEDLSSVESFSRGLQDIHVGEIITVANHDSHGVDVAKIFKIKKPNVSLSNEDDYFVLIFWYYTPEELHERKCKNIKAIPAHYSYIKTTHMGVILGTSIKRTVAKKDGNCICPGKIFDLVKQRIVKDTRKDVAWAF